jgi:SAM-dependent methyltransferase
MGISSTKSALSFARRLLPNSVIQYTARAYEKIQRIRNRNRSPDEIFDEIYRGGHWGGDGSSLCSGEGSRGLPLELSIPPIADVIRHNDIRSILDVGCGDFRFGSALLQKLPAAITYKGIDVSCVVISQLQRDYAGSSRVKFAQIDGTVALLPACDLAIVRQVFQHLSNASIQAVLNNLRDCDHLIVVEHFPPAGELKVLNADISTGLITRRFKNSAVDISAPPFSHNFKFVDELFRIDLLEIGGELVGRHYKAARDGGK